MSHLSSDSGPYGLGDLRRPVAEHLIIPLCGIIMSKYDNHSCVVDKFYICRYTVGVHVTDGSFTP
jgi:hypothetical protein